MLYSLARPVYLVARKFRNRLLNLVDVPVIILIYHRVTTLSSDPELLAVTPGNFRDQMKYLKGQYPLVRLEDDWSDVKMPSIAITFDDGYVDNVLEALPILEEIEVPATFFVSTGNIDTTREFWWDEMARIIMEDRPFPTSFTLDDDHCKGTWPTITVSEREKLYRELHPYIKKMSPDNLAEWLTQFRTWAQADAFGREAYRTMSSEELRLLAASKQVTVGAHTVSHTPLSALSEEQQRGEIFSSRKRLEAVLGKKVETFSYPYGGKKDYNRTSIRLCRNAGFSRATSNFPGQVHRWTDPFQLPRHLVRNWDRETFISRIRSFWTR